LREYLLIEVGKVSPSKVIRSLTEYFHLNPLAISRVIGKVDGRIGAEKRFERNILELGGVATIEANQKAISYG
jgi:hypothetical protein